MKKQKSKVVHIVYFIEVIVCLYLYHIVMYYTGIMIHDESQL